MSEALLINYAQAPRGLRASIALVASLHEAACE